MVSLPVLPRSFGHSGGDQASCLGHPRVQRQQILRADQKKAVKTIAPSGKAPLTSISGGSLEISISFSVLLSLLHSLVKGKPFAHVCVCDVQFMGSKWAWQAPQKSGWIWIAKKRRRGWEKQKLCSF